MLRYDDRTALRNIAAPTATVWVGIAVPELYEIGLARPVEEQKTLSLKTKINHSLLTSIKYSTLYKDCVMKTTDFK